MIGSLPARLTLATLALMAGSFLTSSRTARSQEPQPSSAPETSPGQFFLIDEPIDHEQIERIRASAKQVIARAAAAKSARPILVFEIRPSRDRPSSTTLGGGIDLANFISTELAGAKLTVAYVPDPLKGYAVLPALACDEIVMGAEASIGPITPDGQDVRADYRDPIRFLARRKGREPDLYLGLLDRDADLKSVLTADRQSHYVLAENLPEFLKANPVPEKDILAAWEGGARGVLTARRARDEGLSKLTPSDRVEIATVYRIDSRALSDDPTLLADPRPVRIKIEGRLDSIKEAYLRRRIEQARREGVNLIFFQINSPGGLISPANNVASLIAGIKGIKTVAYVEDRALGVASLLALACDDIVLHKDARIGGITSILTGGKGQAEPLSESQIESLTKKAESLAAQKGHPVALAHAMVDPLAELVQVTDMTNAAPTIVLESLRKAEPTRYVNPSTVKEPGEALTLNADQAATYRLGQKVGDYDEFKALYGLRGKEIRLDGPTWVDGLVTTLNDPFVSWILLFIGVFMLILEVKMPGVGLPAITSALAFLLFFWSRYLSGTADQLEILLFLVGLICLGLELFIFPGFGVFGMSGFLLIVASIVMASHTFVWPTQEYEYRQMAGTLFQVIAVMVGVGVGATLVGRYIPSLPVFNRMVLKPEAFTGTGIEDDPNVIKPPPVEGFESLTFLMGETGRTTTVLKPSGKARFGGLLVDVRADGFFIERDALIEVVDVQGMRVIVKPVA